MTGNDLRTRAEAVVSRRLRRTDPTKDRRGEEYVLGFIAGATWHAAQQPSREQIARAIAESQNPGVPGAFDAQRGAWLTDAVLALWNGADDG